MVAKKLEDSKKSLEIKEKMLEEISPDSNTDKTKKIREFEEKIAEKDSLPVSKEQEALIEEEIEEQFV